MVFPCLSAAKSRIVLCLTSVMLLMLGGCGTIKPDQPSEAPFSSKHPESKKIKLQPKAQEKTVTRSVALLLPLSGEHAALGQSMRYAAELSLFENADDHLVLLFKDTKGTAEGAAAAVQDALKQGAELVLGPVFSYEVRAVLPEVRTRHIPVVSFSSDQSVAGPGSYVLGFSPRDQVRRIVTFAKSKGISRLAVLAPSTPYGVLIISTLKALADEGEAILAASLTYTGKGEKLANDLQKWYSPAFDGLLLPVGGEELKILLANLQASGFDLSKVRLLGTGIWDDAKTLASPLLAGGWYASVDPSERTSFESHFRESYGMQPERIATLAYDAVSLAAVLSQRHALHPFHERMLTHPRGFAGVDGVFRLKAQEITERSLAILEITPGGVQVISPAQNHF